MDVESANWFDNGTGEEARFDMATRGPNEGTASTDSVPQTNRTSETVGRLGSATRRSARPLASRGLAPWAEGELTWPNGCLIHLLLLR